MKCISIPRLGLAKTPTYRRIVRENVLDIFNAEIWAREALLALQGNMILGNIVTRDFSPLVSKFGDLVNVARPGVFKTSRKAALCDDVSIQAATANSFQVPLDQYLYTTFKICDGEENREMVDLVNTFLLPAVQSMALKVDIILAGQHVNFWQNAAGHLGGMTSSNVSDYLVDTREVMNRNKVPIANRKMAITSTTESLALKEQLFVNVAQSGSDRALRDGEMGRLFGFDFFMVNNQPIVSSGQAAVTTTIDNVGGYNPGTKTVTLTSSTGLSAGQWMVIAGDDIPQQITNIGSSGAVSFAPGLASAVANGAAVTAIKVGAIVAADGYLGNVFTQYGRSVGYSDYLLTGSWTAGTAPQIGQPVSFGTDSNIYTIIDVMTTDDDGNALSANQYNIQLDRPLAANVANAATVNLGPAGNYNFAFNDNSLATVFRPLPKPRTGAMSAVVVYDNIPMRVVITYSGFQNAHIVTIDLLMGVATYDPIQGAVMYG